LFQTRKKATTPVCCEQKKNCERHIKDLFIAPQKHYKKISEYFSRALASLFSVFDFVSLNFVNQRTPFFYAKASWYADLIEHGNITPAGVCNTFNQFKPKWDKAITFRSTISSVATIDPAFFLYAAKRKWLRCRG